MTVIPGRLLLKVYVRKSVRSLDLKTEICFLKMRSVKSERNNKRISSGFRAAKCRIKTIAQVGDIMRSLLKCLLAAEIVRCNTYLPVRCKNVSGI